MTCVTYVLMSRGTEGDNGHLVYNLKDRLQNRATATQQIYSSSFSNVVFVV